MDFKSVSACLFYSKDFSVSGFQVCCSPEEASDMTLNWTEFFTSAVVGYLLELDLGQK